MAADDSIKAAPGREPFPSKVLHGLIASGNQVVDNPNNPFFQSVIKTDTAREILAVEMEGAGAADAVSQMNESGKSISFLMIRGISDLISEDDRLIDAHHDERDLWKKYAADSAAAFTVNLIQKGLPTSPLVQQKNSPDYRSDCVFSLSHQPGSGKKKDLKSILNPISFDLTIAENHGKFTGREWLIERIDEWVNDPNGRRVYWILGRPGIGKTTLAIWYNNICDLSAFYLFQYDNTETINPQRFVRTLAYELSTRIPAYKDLLEKIDLDSKKDLDGPALLNELIIIPFYQLGNLEDQIVILFDGLDEIFLKNGMENIPYEMVQTLLALYHRTESMPFRFIFSSRDNQAVQTELQLDAVESQFIDPDSIQNRDDIREYLRKELGNITGEVIPEKKLEDISAKSEGFFIYASFFCKAVRDKIFSLDEPSFPTGLSAMYLEYFEKQFHDLKEYKRQIIPAIRIICAAREPLPMEILAGVTGLDEEELSDLEMLVTSLFPIDANTISPFHSTIVEWISDKTKAGRYFVSLEKGHVSLSEYGFDQIMSGEIHEYFLRNLPFHLLASRDEKKLSELMVSQEFFVRSYESDFQALQRLWVKLEEETSLRMESVYDVTSHETVNFSKAFLMNVGTLLWRMGRLSVAYDWFVLLEKAAKIEDDNDWIGASLGNQALILQARGDHDGAMKHHMENRTYLSQTWQCWWYNKIAW